VTPRCIYDALPWHTRPLRWSIHRLASFCTDVHSRNPIARRRDEAQWPYRSRLPARAIPLLSPMMPWPLRRGRQGAYNYITLAHASPRCLGYCPIRVILPDPLLRLPTRIPTGDETFPRCGSCSLALKRTSTASTTTPRARAQPRATLPSHPPLDVHRVHRSSPKCRPTPASPLSSSKPALLLARRRRALSRR
jgi:hypothetical protein